LDGALGLETDGGDGGDEDGEIEVELARGDRAQLKPDVAADPELDDLQVVELAVGVDVDPVGSAARGVEEQLELGGAAELAAGEEVEEAAQIEVAGPELDRGAEDGLDFGDRLEGGDGEL